MSNKTMRGADTANGKKIYSKWVAYELRTRGHKVLRVEVNRNKPELDVWVFEMDDTLLEDLTQITQPQRV